MLRRNSLVRISPFDSRHRIVPFHLPSITDSIASIGQADTSFFETGTIPSASRTDNFVSTNI